MPGQWRVEQWQAMVHAAESTDEEMQIRTKLEVMKYVVYPQTLALNANRWYQDFTKTLSCPSAGEEPEHPWPWT